MRTNKCVCPRVPHTAHTFNIPWGLTGQLPLLLFTAPLLTSATATNYSLHNTLHVLDTVLNSLHVQFYSHYLMLFIYNNVVPAKVTAPK